MNKNERILLIIATCLVGAFLLSYLGGGKSGASSLGAKNSEETPEFPEFPDLQGVYVFRHVEGDIDFLEPKPGIRDPFGFHASAEGNSSGTAFKLTGVFDDGGEKFAILSWRETRKGVTRNMKEILPEGAEVRGWTILKIQERGVWMRKDGEKRFFVLHSGTGLVQPELGTGKEESE